MSSMSESERARLTTGYLGRVALAIGILAVVQNFTSFALLTWVWPGDPVAIGVLTALHYAVPVVGIVIGHLARRREGASPLSTIGLVFSYLTLAYAVVSILVGLVDLLVTS